MNLPQVKFLLKNPKDTKPSLIYMVARYQNQKIVYSTGIKILPELWDFVEQRPTQEKTILRKFPKEKDELNDITLMLDQRQITLNEIFRTFKVKNRIPAPEQIKEELNQIFKKESKVDKKINLFSFIEEFNRTTNKRPVTIKGYKTTLNHLINFNNQNRRKLDFDTIDLDFYDEFVKYFQEKGYALNTIGNNLKNVKVFMSEATERGINTNLMFRNKRFKVPKETTDQIYLNESEIKKLSEIDLIDKPRLDNVRDIFVAACYTGLRFSDLNQINKQNIVNGKHGRLLKVKTQKTGEGVVIPLNVIVEEILAKREGKLPKIMSNQKLNSYLKELGKLAELSEKIPITKTKGKLRSTSSVPKYKLISVHTARRSFASNAYLAEVPVISIMKITGHKTERAFMKYIRITKEQNAEKLFSHPFFQSKLKIVK